MLIKELRGTESTQDACAKMRVGHASSLHLSPALALFLLSLSFYLSLLVSLYGYLSVSGLPIVRDQLHSDL